MLISSTFVFYNTKCQAPGQLNTLLKGTLGITVNTNAETNQSVIKCDVKGYVRFVIE